MEVPGVRSGRGGQSRCGRNAGDPRGSRVERAAWSWHPRHRATHRRRAAGAVRPVGRRGGSPSELAQPLAAHTSTTASSSRRCRVSRADAAWVGWDFVAHDPAFAELCERLGVLFVGASSQVMRKVGVDAGRATRSLERRSSASRRAGHCRQPRRRVGARNQHQVRHSDGTGRSSWSPGSPSLGAEQRRRAARRGRRARTGPPACAAPRQSNSVTADRQRLHRRGRAGRIAGFTCGHRGNHRPRPGQAAVARRRGRAVARRCTAPGWVRRAGSPRRTGR